jgi:hypothetical protein
VVNPTFVADKPGSYVVQLIVNDGVVNSAPDTVTVTVTPVTTLSLRAAGRQVQLNWTDAGVAGYAIYRGTVPGGPYLRIAEVPGSQLLFIDRGLVVGATCYWVVRPIGSGGIELSQSNEVTAKIVGR